MSDVIVPDPAAKLECAVMYLKRGWKIFILGHEKTPLPNCAACHNAPPEHDREACTCLTCHGFYAATGDRNRLDMMLTLYPNGQLAVRTGEASGIIVVDAEGTADKGLPSGLAVLDNWETWVGEWDMPETLTAMTPSGGVHRYFQWIAGVKSRNRVLPGIDVKSDKGYVALPCGVGDRHWINQLPVMPPSDHLMVWLRTANSRTAGGPAGFTSGYDYSMFTKNGCPGGHRDEFFNDMCFRLRKTGASLGEAKVEIRKHWEKAAQPPAARWFMPWDNVLYKIERVWATVAPDAQLPTWRPPAIKRPEPLKPPPLPPSTPSVVVTEPEVDATEEDPPSDSTGDGPTVPPVDPPDLPTVEPEPEPDPEPGQSEPESDPGDEPDEATRRDTRVDERDQDEQPGDEFLSDMGNANRFIRLFGENIRFVTETKKWYLWDGNRWVFDILDKTMHMTRDVANDIRRQALLLQDNDEARQVGRFALSTESLRSLRAMRELAGSDPRMAVRVDDMDRNPHLLVVKNGVLDLRTQKLVTPQRNDLNTRCANVVFDPIADCPRWLEHIRFVTRSNTILAAYLRRAIGYTLTGLVREQVFFMLEGGGSNGKNAFIEPVVAIMGDYAQTGTSALITGGDEQHPTILADLVGCRLVFVDEARQGRPINVERVKQLTGSKRVKARRMGRDFFEFDAQLKLWIAGNNHPTMKDPSDGVWRRLHRIMFKAKVKQSQKIADYGQALFDEEAAGILNWALEGLRDWQQLNGLGRPNDVEQATLEVQAEEDLVGQFMEEVCFVTHDTGDRVTVNELYIEYSMWCTLAGIKMHDRQTRIAFGRELAAKGFERFNGRVDGKMQRGFIGLRVGRSANV